MREPGKENIPLSIRNEFYLYFHSLPYWGATGTDRRSPNIGRVSENIIAASLFPLSFPSLGPKDSPKDY